MTGLRFDARRLDDLTPREVHALLRLRAEVFVVEQTCAYLDPDDTDLVAWHLLVTEGGGGGTVVGGASASAGAACASAGAPARDRGEPGRLVGYARYWDAADGAHIGRVITARDVRGTGLGHAILSACLARIGPRRVTLHAQDHLRRFYAAHGFVPHGDVYPEDGIPHVTMVRPGD